MEGKRSECKRKRKRGNKKERECVCLVVVKDHNVDIGVITANDGAEVVTQERSLLHTYRHTDTIYINTKARKHTKYTTTSHEDKVKQSRCQIKTKAKNI